MTNQLVFIGERISKEKKQLAKELFNLTGSEYKQKSKRYKIEKELLNHTTELIQYLGDSLSTNVQVTKRIEIQATYIGELTTKSGISLKEAIQFISPIRNIIWTTFEKEIEDKISRLDILSSNKIIDPLIDEAIYILIKIYEENNKEIVEVAYRALEELSVPVIPITEDIGIMSIIGEIDTRRSALIMETALNKSSSLKFKVLFLDISGVEIIDTMVADNLFNVIYALKLLGVKTVITGIRPEIAQTTVKLGIDFKTIDTKSTLAQALKEIGIKDISKDIQ
ncbi:MULTISPECIES: STAS domain-containing protein [Priestia]|uniref:STAS domain-containing protein n=1 Tax=Priestia TaxID=2800373 RepID=UPI0012B7B223|nr:MULTISPECIES: STAS domain-containing protein [Priestia]MED3992962.1 STAS domain-containing protein [Priestia aryabhattai]MED4045193.1 STAS domain-containing protein [Priestia aryabhattai]